MLNRARRKVRKSREPRLARNGGVSVVEFFASAVVRWSGGVLTNHVDGKYGLVWPSLGNGEASAGLCTLTPFRSSLVHEPCVGRGGIDQETGEIFPARGSGRLFLASHEPPRLSRHRKALFDATVSGCERFIETCGYLDRCHNTRRTSACARREGLSRAPPIPTTPTHLTTSS